MPPPVNNNNPVRNTAPVNAMPQPGGTRPPARLADYALTIDDFRNFASGKFNAGGAEPGKALENRHRWQSLENPKPNLSEAAAIRLSFAFALEDAGVSGAKLDAALRRLGLNADFSFAGGDLSVQPLSREEVKDIIEQSLGKRKEPQADAPRPDPFPGLGPVLPQEEAPQPPLGFEAAKAAAKVCYDSIPEEMVPALDGRVRIVADSCKDKDVAEVAGKLMGRILFHNDGRMRSENGVRKVMAKLEADVLDMRKWTFAGSDPVAARATWAQVKQNYVDEKWKSLEDAPQAKPEPQGANVPANVPVAPAKAEAKAANGLPKIGSQAEFKAFIQSLRTDSAFGTVSEDAEEKDVNGDMKKTFTYTGLVFRLDDRGIDHPTMANGFTSKNDLALSKNKTEAMGLGTGFIDNEGKFVHGEYGITGESGVSTAKTIDGCIQYRHGKCSLFVIDTSKLPPGEKAWDMESTLYRNGYREKHGGIDETTGEVNVSSIPKSAIVGWVEIDDGTVFGDIKDNGKRLEHVQTQGRFVFNAEYKAD